VTWVLAVLLAAWIAWGPLVPVLALALLAVPRVRWWVLDHWYVPRRVAAYVAGAAAVLAGVVVVVPDGWLPIPPAPGLLATPGYLGRPATARPVAAGAVPQHPALAANGRGAHLDAWGSEAYPWPGPLGLQPEVDTAWFGLEECVGLGFDAKDRLLAQCGDPASGQALHVVDPESMHKLAGHDLPRREGEERSGEELCARTSFFLDAHGRAVLATAERQVLALRTADADGRPEVSVDQTWDLRPYVPDGDCLVALMPDWAGRTWWVSREGLVGAIAPDTGDVRVHDLGETVASSVAVDESGVYVVSDRALYRLAAAADGQPHVTWRTEYDRGEERKPGQPLRGSGAAPTLLDDGVVAIADNAEPRMNVVFLERAGGTEICRQPVFEEDASATGAALVSVGSGVVVENNHGYRGPRSTLLGLATSPGLARVDLAGRECRLRWTSDQVAPSSVARASWANGLVYAYTKRPSWTGVSAWYVTALDVGTGRAMWSVRTGTGALMNNDHAAVTLGPDGSLWVPTLAGLVRVRDRR
jgi:hypothetical protein